MTDENALIPIQDLGLQKYDDDAFDNIAANGFMPRVQLMTSSSKPCKEGEFPVNHYALVKGQQNIDLSGEVNCLVITWRPKAMRMGDSVMAVYDINNPEFKKIEEESGEQDSGCMYGPEFLIYLPNEKEFATLFMGSKTARNESPNLKALIGKAATLGHQKISNKKYTWVSIQVTPCSTPFDIPPIESIQEVAEKFNNPPETDVETVDDDEVSDRAR